MPQIPQITRKTGLIAAAFGILTLSLTYSAIHFKLGSRLSKCNRDIEELLDLYSSPNIDSILAKDASRAKELFDGLEQEDCKADEFVKPKYTKLYNLVVP